MFKINVKLTIVSNWGIWNSNKGHDGSNSKIRSQLNKLERKVLRAVNNGKPDIIIEE